MQELVLSVSDFVVVFNQTLEYAYPNVTIQGELSNFRVSKNRWVYFDLKDETASVKFFGTVYQLPGPLEDGLLVQVNGQPRLHPLYGFSINVQFIQPVGEGSLKRAAALLETKLAAEGLFDPTRKRPLPYPPKRIGLITSAESAAYRDFTKILNQRWGGAEILLADTQVQGEPAISQISAALEYFNTHADPVDVIVITRGGGSAEDMAVFNVEQVVRAVAGSRIPTLVAIGHEIDICLAEMAADVRASTPSNAAELLVPDKVAVLRNLEQTKNELARVTRGIIADEYAQAKRFTNTLETIMNQLLHRTEENIQQQAVLLEAYNPFRILKRGYSVTSINGKTINSVQHLKIADKLSIRMVDGNVETIIDNINNV